MITKHWYQTIVLILCFSLTASWLAPAVFAADTGSVTATVTAQNISVTLDKASVSFGTIGTSSTKDTTSTGINDSITATNNGNVTEKINIKSANSTSSGAGWTLGTNASSETYTLKFCTATCDTTPAWNSISTDYATLAASVTATNTQVFDIQVGTPTSTTDYNQQSISITIQATTP